MSPTPPPPPPPLYSLHGRAPLKDSCLEKPFRLRGDTVTLHPEQLMSTESRLQCGRPAGGPQGGSAALPGGRGRDFMAHPVDRFPHFLPASRASNGVLIVYTGRRSDSSSSFPPRRSRLISPPFCPSPLVCCFFSPRFSPPSVLSPDSSTPPTSLSC